VASAQADIYSKCELWSEKGCRQCGGAVVPVPPFKICAPHFMFSPRLLHTSNIVFFKCSPFLWFLAPCCEILATTLDIAFWRSWMQRSPLFPYIVSSGVRDGGAGRAGAPPRIEKFRANFVFRPSSSCSKILKDKKYFKYSEKFQGKFCFSGQAQVVQNSEW